MSQRVRQVENLHAHLPTIDLDYGRSRGVSEDAVPVAGEATISAFPGHVIEAGGRQIAIAPEAVRAALTDYARIHHGGLNRIYAMPELQASGQPLVMRMAKNTSHVVSEVTEGMVASALVEAYRESLADSTLAPSSERFSPIPIVGIANVPTAVPTASPEISYPVEMRAALLMPFVHGENLQERIDAGRRLTSTQVGALAHGFDQWIAVATKHGYVHTDLKPANLLVAADGEQLVPVDHTIASASRLVEHRKDIPGPLPKVSPYWYNGGAINQAIDEFQVHGDSFRLLHDLAAAQRATVARIALTAYLGRDPIPQSAYTGSYQFCSALNTPKAYEPALQAAARQGLDPELVTRLRQDLRAGLVGTDGEAPVDF